MNETQIYSTTEKIVAGIFVYILDASLITGNALVIVAFLNDCQLQITRNYYIFSLALSDIVIGVFVIPVYSSTIWLSDWVLGVPFCIIWIIINQTALINSHAAIFLITYDRYILVQNAIKYTVNETPEKAKCRILVIFCLTSATNTGLTIFGEWYYSLDGLTCSCSPYTPVEVPYFVGLHVYDIIVTLFATSVTVFFPLGALIVLNRNIYCMVRKRIRKTGALNTLIQNSLPSVHVIANLNMGQDLLKSPTIPTITLPVNDKRPKQGRTIILRSTGSISQVPNLEPISEEKERELQQMRAKVVQWLDKIPTEEVLALSNVYKEDHSQANSDRYIITSGLNENVANEDDANDNDSYDNDSIFEVVSPPKAQYVKRLQEELQLSSSSLSSISSLQLGEEANSSHGSKHDQSELIKNGLLKSKNYQTHSYLPTVSKAVSILSPVVNPQVGGRRKNGRNSVSSVKILAKYKLKQDRKAAITITLLILLFLLFKVPYALALLFNAIFGTYWVSLKAYETFTWLYWAKSVTNPFVYAFISKRFRSYCVKLFCRMKNICTVKT